MKISYNWLKEFIPDLSLSPAEVAEKLTMHSFEVEVDRIVKIDPSIVVAKITKIEAHPDADRLRLATIDNGQQEVTVVCGAPNIDVGDVVPYAPIGSQVQDENGDSWTLKEAKIRGVVSVGMLTSARELGLGLWHSGILQLDPETSIGSAVNEHFPEDTVLDVDLTPNRAHDCYSHIGIARELAGLLGLSVVKPELADTSDAPVPEGWTVSIEDAKKTPRYIGSHLTGITNKISPSWLQARLFAVGARPIDALVDITNYVMFEMGIPTHAFDADKLPGKNIGVRFAKKGEKTSTLDGQERDLTLNTLLITSEDEPVAIAGVMGGDRTQVSSDTTNIWLEVANFHPYTIQQASWDLALSTEGSSRWIKAVDPKLSEAGTARTIKLLQEVCGAEVRGITDSYPDPQSITPIEFNPKMVTEVAGSPVSEDQCEQAFIAMRFKVAKEGSTWQVTRPSNRLDIQGQHDLNEEVLRVIGLNTIPLAEYKSVTPSTLPPEVYWRDVILDTLISLGGMQVYNSSFEPVEMAELLGIAESPHISLKNPPAPNLGNLRTSLLPGILNNLVRNREVLHRNAGRKESALFEIGNVYSPGENGRVPGIIEHEHLAGAIIGDNPTLDQISEALATKLGVDSINLTNLATDQTKSGLKFRESVTLFEISLTELVQSIEKPIPATSSLEELKQEEAPSQQYQPISKYPASFRDISLIVSSNVTVEQVQEVIERAGGQQVTDVDLFDIYESDQGTSYAFHITHESHNQTLTDSQVAEVHNQILATLQEELSARIRE